MEGEEYIFNKTFLSLLEVYVFQSYSWAWTAATIYFKPKNFFQLLSGKGQHNVQQKHKLQQKIQDDIVTCLPFKNA